MLYDPRHEHGTLAHFAAWLETQPADEPYEFESSECAVTYYLRTVALKSSKELFEIYMGHDPSKVVAAQPHTYGAALARARMALMRA